MELTIEQALQQAITAHQEGKLQEAERLYRAILQSQPAHPDANHNLGVIALSVNKADAALPLFKTALEANPKIEQFWLSYIDALIKEKQFEIAKAVLEQAKTQGLAGEKINALQNQLKHIPATPKLFDKNKNLTLKEKRQKVSESKKQKRQNDNTNHPSPSQQQINSLLEYYQAGQYSDAENLARSFTQQFPNLQFGWKILGAVLKQIGRISESLAAMKKSVHIDPQDAEAHSNLGVTFLELGRLDEAEASYRLSIALKPDYAGAHSNLGNTLQKLGRLLEAEISYTNAIALKPDYAEAHYNLGITRRKLGKLDESEVSLRQAIALKPDFAEAYSNLGNALLELGRSNEAEASLRQAIALKSDFPEAHNNLANTLVELGRLVEAEASYTQAITLKPGYTGALRNRWDLLFSQKRYEAALKDADLCIAKGARELDLTTLYALGQTEEIYKRIETQSKIDGENISIASFAAFFSESEKKQNAYNFCPNPMDFIYFSNLSSNLKDSDVYITELIKELGKVETVWEPHGRATRGGFQTLYGMNLFESPSEKIAQLKSIIIDELTTYYLKFQNQSCSYIKKWPCVNNFNAWHVVLKQQGHQNPHIHPTGWLSGVIYLKVVPPLGKDEGAIEFSLNSTNYSGLDSPKLTYQPEFGDMVFFPSSLHHRTIPFTTDADRIIVSFDLIPKVAEHRGARLT